MMKTVAKKDERAAAGKLATLVVGVGSGHGDDQFGWLVVGHLAAAIDDPSISIRAARSPAELLDWLDGVERLIVCDACQGLGSPGAIHAWVWPDVPCEALRTAGTHDLGLAAALELAEQLRLLPAETLLWCVEIETPQPGESVSACIETAAIRAAQIIRLAIVPTFRDFLSEFPPNFRRPRGLGGGRQLAEIVAARRRRASVQFARHAAKKLLRPELVT